MKKNISKIKAQNFYLCVIPPHVQPIIGQNIRMLVDMVECQFYTRHYTATYDKLNTHHAILYSNNVYDNELIGQCVRVFLLE